LLAAFWPSEPLRRFNVWSVEWKTKADSRRCN
jgi:hypothetical protein